jgi:glucosamine-6-phosphate deaminase
MPEDTHMRSWKQDELIVRIYTSRKELAKAAAIDFAITVQDLLTHKDSVHIVFAADPSQKEFLQYIAADTSIDFSRIHAYQMHEYLGLPAESQQSTAAFLTKYLFAKQTCAVVDLIDNQAVEPDQESQRYGDLLTLQGIDIVCMGIGENGHIAGNNPPSADFNDPLKAKVVALTRSFRRQQVNDLWFSTMNEVPSHAITLTIPTLASGTYHYCLVPTEAKADAVRDTLYGDITTEGPATILRTWPQSILYLDPYSAKYL